MREILFRGKRIDTGEWVYGYVAIHTIIGDETELKTVIVQKPDKIYQYDSWIVDPETIGQYAGLDDKNGKKIFGGDVLRDDEYFVIVEFVDGGFSVDYGTMDGKWAGYGDLYAYLEVYNGGIIGNVHDNPELMKLIENIGRE